MPAGMQISPSRRADIPELSQFLAGGFGGPESNSCFSHDMLAWKYFDGPAGVTEASSCSLVARSAGKIVGHIGICHRQFVVPGDTSEPVSTLHAIDWLGSADHSGSGAFLMLQALGTSKTQYAVGGSEQAQSVFPRLGFEKKPNLTVYRKVLNPFHRLRSDEGRTLRKLAGTVKDMVSVWGHRAPTVSQAIELRPAPTFTGEIDGLLHASPLRSVTCQRDHSLLNYFLRCPEAGFSGWTIHDSQEVIGFVVLKITAQGQIRDGKIVDCWLKTQDLAYWHATVAAVLDRLRALSADYVTCYAATPELDASLNGNGFYKYWEKSVYVRDKARTLPQDRPFAFSILEADHAIV